MPGRLLRSPPGRRGVAAVAAVVALAGLLGCASPTAPVMVPSPASSSMAPASPVSTPPAATVAALAEHPLAGRIWDARARRFVDDEALVSRAAAARFLLLGELHDNPEQHRLRHALLKELLARGRRLAIAMEQLDLDRQGKIDHALAGGDATPDAVVTATQARDRGWNWAWYAPFVALAIEHRLPLVAANLSRESARQVVRGGFAALGTDRAERLAVDAVWSDPLEQALRRQIVDSHCGASPGPIIGGMVRAQRARDASMAEAIAGWRAGGVALLAGNGHVRRDWGVPHYLRRYVPDLAGEELLVIGYLEVDAGSDDPETYTRSPIGPEPVYDLVRFTLPAVRPDPCAALRRDGMPRS